jgi:predicted nucleic acid-binding protein
MILDTTFLIDLEEEVERGVVGAASQFLGSHRNVPSMVTVISLGELAAGMRNSHEPRRFLSRFHVMHLKPEIALSAADIDRRMMSSGSRLGENDTWIAGFAAYYGVPIVSNDAGFDRVEQLRRISY